MPALSRRAPNVVSLADRRAAATELAELERSLSFARRMLAEAQLIVREIEQRIAEVSAGSLGTAAAGASA